MHDSNSRANTATDSLITTSPFAMIIRGHTWLAELHDETAPIWVSRQDARPAWEIEHLDARCPGGCDSRQAIQKDDRGVLVVTGHADGCGWYQRWLRRAGLSLGVSGPAVTAVP